MTFTIQLEREDDGRWLAEVPALSGAMCYGQDREDAIARVQALALQVIANASNTAKPRRIRERHLRGCVSAWRASTARPEVLEPGTGTWSPKPAA
jgi:predicted RNase H-like HicB family nuclease